MKSLTLAILSMLLVASSLVLGSPKDQVKADPVSEDYNTFTKIDPASDITVTSSNLTFNTMGSTQNSYVYKDKGIAGISGDFVYDFDFNISSPEQELVMLCFLR